MCCFQGTTKKFDQEVVKYYTMKLTIEVTREKNSNKKTLPNVNITN